MKPLERRRLAQNKRRVRYRKVFCAAWQGRYVGNSGAVYEATSCFSFRAGVSFVCEGCAGCETLPPIDRAVTGPFGPDPAKQS